MPFIDHGWSHCMPPSSPSPASPSSPPPAPAATTDGVLTRRLAAGSPTQFLRPTQRREGCECVLQGCECVLYVTVELCVSARAPWSRAGGNRETLLQTLSHSILRLAWDRFTLGLRPVRDPSRSPGTGLVQRDRSHGLLMLMLLRVRQGTSQCTRFRESSSTHTSCPRCTQRASLCRRAVRPRRVSSPRNGQDHS